MPADRRHLCSEVKDRRRHHRQDFERVKPEDSVPEQQHLPRGREIAP
jgi:hypothetical protein